MPNTKKINRRSLILKELSLIALGIIVTGWSVRELTLGASSSVSVGLTITDTVDPPPSSSSSSYFSSSSSVGYSSSASITVDRQFSSTTGRNPSKILALIEKTFGLAASESPIQHAAPEDAPKIEESAEKYSESVQENQGEERKTQAAGTVSKQNNGQSLKRIETMSKLDQYRREKNVANGSVKSVSGNFATPSVSLDTCTLTSLKCVKDAFAADRRLIADVISDIFPIPNMKFIEQLPATEPIIWALGVFWLALITRGTLLVVAHYR